MGARGNRLVGVARLGVAFVATAAVALGQALPASAQEAAPASSAEATPAETATADTPSTTTAAEHTSTQSAPADATPTAPAKEPETKPKARRAGPGGHQAGEHRARPESTPSSSTALEHTSDTPSASTPAETAPAASEPAAVPKDAVKLEPTAAPAAPAAAPPAAPAPQPAAPAPSAPPSPTIVLQVESAAEPEPSEAANAEAATGANAEAATGATALIVSIRPRAGIYLLPAEEPAVKTVRSIRKARTIGKQLVQGTCARPAARVPLSELCVEARAFAVLRATFTASPTPEVRAAMERVAARVTARRGEARAVSVEGRQETHGRRSTTDHPLRQLGPRRRQRRFQRLARIVVVVPTVRACSGPLAGAAAVPACPRPRAQHASARRDRSSSHRSTRIAPPRFQIRPAGKIHGRL